MDVMAALGASKIRVSTENLTFSSIFETSLKVFGGSEIDGDCFGCSLVYKYEYSNMIYLTPHAQKWPQCIA